MAHPSEQDPVSPSVSPMNLSMSALPVYHQFPELLQLMSIESVMPSNHLIFCRPLLLLPPIPPIIRVHSNELTLHMRGQSSGISASISVLPMISQDWSLLEWTGWISLQSKGLSSVFSNTTVQKQQFFVTQFSSQSKSHPHMTTGKTIALTRWTFDRKVISLLLNMLSRFVITFVPRSKCLLISWLQSPSAVILEHPKIKSDTVSTVSPSISHEVMGPDAMILAFWIVSFKPTFSISSRGFLIPLHFLP